MAKYPEFICHDCGVKYGGWYKKGSYTGPAKHYATYHNGCCGICSKVDVPVTEPRDYGHLRAKWATDIMEETDK